MTVKITYAYAGELRYDGSLMDTAPSGAPAATLDALKRLKAFVLDTVISPESKRIYGRGIDCFLTWVETERPSAGFTDATVRAFKTYLMESRSLLSSSTVNMYLTAVRRLAAKAAEKGLLPSESASAIARVKGLRRQGIGTTPLSIFEAENLINRVRWIAGWYQCRDLLLSWSARRRERLATDDYESQIEGRPRFTLPFLRGRLRLFQRSSAEHENDDS